MGGPAGLDSNRLAAGPPGTISSLREGLRHYAQSVDDAGRCGASAQPHLRSKRVRAWAEVNHVHDGSGSVKLLVFCDVSRAEAVVAHRPAVDRPAQPHLRVGRDIAVKAGERDDVAAA